MRLYRLESQLLLPRPLEEVFPFFADAHNLEALTPPWLNFRILTPDPIAMAPGDVIRYRLRLWGVPVTWESEITVWEPPHRFVDVQRQGPYRFWAHEHLFQPREDGTLVQDRVRYAVPGGPLEDFVQCLFVRPSLRRIWAYRRRRLRELFPPLPQGAPQA